MWFKTNGKVKKVKILLKFLINLYTCFQGCLGQFWFRLWSSYMCILLKPAMEKLGNARALYPASLLGGLMSYHCLLDQWPVIDIFVPMTCIKVENVLFIFLVIDGAWKTRIPGAMIHDSRSMASERKYSRVPASE